MDHSAPPIPSSCHDFLQEASSVDLPGAEQHAENVAHRTRPRLAIKNLSQPFMTTRHYGNQQYAGLYYCRLQQLRTSTMKTAQALWPTTRFVASVSTAADTDSFLVGTFFKEMRLKPSVLKEYIKMLDVDTPLKSYVSDDDLAYLEDDTGRVRLVPSDRDSSFNHNQLVTGMIIAVRGKRGSQGRFFVEDWTFPRIPASVSWPPLAENSPARTYVAIVSDLRIGDVAIGPDGRRRLALLKELLLGTLGGGMESDLSGNIGLLLCVGNAMGSIPFSGDSVQPTKTALSTENTKQVLDEVDTFVSEVASSVQTVLVPGPDDPTSYALPQLPLHPTLFTRGRMLPGLSSLPNPCFVEIEGLRFLLSAGQGLKDLREFAEHPSDIVALRNCVQARLVAPTAPDTICCYPFSSYDPFVIPPPNVPTLTDSSLCAVDHEEAAFPHVVVSAATGQDNEGSQGMWVWHDRDQELGVPQGGRRTAQRDRRILTLTADSFHRAGEVALLNLATLEITNTKLG